MYILSQVLVCISDLFLILSMLSKNKKGVVFYLILSTILFVSHYICLDAWTGAGIGIIELVFLIVMYLLEKYEKTKYNLHVTIVTMLATILLSIFTWAGWISVLPMIAMIIYLIGMIYTNVVVVKSGTFIRLILNATYMFLLASYFGAGLTIVLLIFTIVGIVRDTKVKKNKE